MSHAIERVRSGRMKTGCKATCATQVHRPRLWLAHWVTKAKGRLFHLREHPVKRPHSSVLSPMAA